LADGLEMCRMLGLKNFVFQRHREILENFFELAEAGKSLPEDTPGHLDGWGIGFYKNGKAVVRKSGGSIVEEKREFFKTCERVKASSILLLHLRKSSWAGSSQRAHAHPFAAGNILFAHNGTIRDFKALRKKITHDPPHIEALDSEVYFRYVMNFAPLGLARAFRRAVHHIKTRHTYSSLTCLFTDGNLIYGFREYTKDPWYYSLYYTPAEEPIIVASEPVFPRLHWTMLPRGKLFIF
jgi:predicted glutamine amidotransferase